jgi:hypothetical protein
MNKIQLQSHIRACELIQKTQRKEKAILKVAIAQKKDPLIELLNSIPRLKKSKLNDNRSSRLSRGMVSPVHNPSIHEPTTERNK